MSYSRRRDAFNRTTDVVRETCPTVESIFEDAMKQVKTQTTAMRDGWTDTMAELLEAKDQIEDLESQVSDLKSEIESLKEEIAEAARSAA